MRVNDVPSAISGAIPGWRQLSELTSYSTLRSVDSAGTNRKLQCNDVMLALNGKVYKTSADASNPWIEDDDTGSSDASEVASDKGQIVF